MEVFYKKATFVNQQAISFYQYPLANVSANKA